MRSILILFVAIIGLQAEEYYAQLVRIVDGDTIVVVRLQRVVTCRLAGIDTPEKFKNLKAIKDAKKAGVSVVDMLNVGTQASNYTNSIMLLGANYKITEAGTDKYKRTLCLVHNASLLINAEIAAAGYAVAYKNAATVKNKDAREAILAAQATAKKEKKGLWATNPTILESLK